MPKKPNSHSDLQEYVPAGNGDASGEYADDKGGNTHFKAFAPPQKEQAFGSMQNPTGGASAGGSNGKSFHGVINKLKSYEGKEVGTYDYHTGKKVNLTDGFMVTFHQNEADENGHYKSHYGKYDPEEYDRLTEEFARDNDAEVFIGVFDEEPEISFKVKNYKQAYDLMVKYNQHSMWDNATAATGDYDNALIINPHYDKTKNPLRGD